ncbi:hypothetical protein BASA_1662 [Bifidobacterium animalis subsp. animalis]|nr:hypothetical protein BASA_1662 [Bifidobacterium animalis subsp. animalis]
MSRLQVRSRISIFGRLQTCPVCNSNLNPASKRHLTCHVCRLDLTPTIAAQIHAPPLHAEPHLNHRARLNEPY